MFGALEDFQPIVDELIEVLRRPSHRLAA